MHDIKALKLPLVFNIVLATFLLVENGSIGTEQRVRFANVTQNGVHAGITQGITFNRQLLLFTPRLF